MKILLTIVLLLLATDSSVARQTFTLNEAILAALQHNYNVRISHIEQEKAENMVTRGNSGQLPSITFDSNLNLAYKNMELSPGSLFENLIVPEGGQLPGTITYDGVHSRSLNAGLGARFVIYDGMKGRLRYQILETGSNLADLQHRSEMESTVLEVTRKYMQAALLQNAISLKELALTQSRDRYEILEVRRAYGQASEQQFLQSLADLKADSTEYRDLIHQFETAYRDLHTGIGWGRRDIKPLDMEIRSADIPRYDELLQSVMENNTVLHVRQARIEKAELDHKLVQANFLPSLTANAQYGYMYQYASNGLLETQGELGVTGGVSFKIPIFTGGKTKTASQNARASLRQEKIRYDDSEKQIRTQFENSWGQFLYLGEKLAAERANLDVYQRNYERANDSFERGLITGTELRTAQQSLEYVRVRISETEFQLKLTETTLLYLSGRLFTIQ